MSHATKQKRKSLIVGLLGILILIIGIFLGRHLLTLLSKKIKENLCIESAAQESFKLWVGDASKRESTFLIKTYYWNITNVDRFLYHQELPKLEQVGPYIYRFAFEKIDVFFLSDSIKYKTMKQIEYDDQATRKECPQCAEHDMLSIINTGYIALMWGAGSDLNFALSLIPSLIANLVNSDAIIESLGTTYTETFPSNFTMFPQDWKIDYAQYTNKNYSLSEMKGLYQILKDPVKLGVAAPPPSYCINDPINATCLQSGFVPLVQSLLARQSMIPAQNLSTDIIFTTLFGSITLLFCPNATHECFNIALPNELQMVTQYITNHLVKLAMYAIIDMHGYGIVSTLKQSEHSVGWTMSKLKIPGFPDGLPIPGLVGNHTNKTTAKSTLKTQQYYKCNVAGKLDLAWKSYDNANSVPQHYFPTASNELRRINNRLSRSFIGFKDSLKVCSIKQEVAQSTYYIYDSLFQSSVKIDRTTVDTVKSVHVENFEPDLQQLYGVNNHSVFIQGVHDATKTTVLPFLLSGPHFLGASPDLINRFNMKPEKEKHTMVFKFEPVSGALFSASIRLQINTVLTKKSISAPRSVPLNISYADDMDEKFTKPFPVMWTVVSIIPTDEQAKMFALISSILKGSCASIVLGPVIGLLMIGLAIYLFIKAVKRNTIAVETLEESKSSSM